MAEPIPAAVAMKSGSKMYVPFVFSPARTNMIAVYGSGKMMDAAPMRDMMKIPM